MSSIMEQYKAAATGSKEKQYFYRRLPRNQLMKSYQNLIYKMKPENHARHIAYMVKYNARTKERRYKLLLSPMKCDCCGHTVQRGYMNRHKKTKRCIKRGELLKKKGIEKGEV